MMSLSRSLTRAAAALSDARALLITAGAGMGVDSGLPAFRTNDGFWRAYPPLKALNVSFVDMANPGWFYDAPNLAWGFYGHRLLMYRDTNPHPGFGMLLELARQVPSFVFTSNVDGHFQKAGFDRARIVECHGSLHHVQCLLQCSTDIHAAHDVQPRVDPVTFEAATESLPHCRRCGNLVRPNVLMFGDSSWYGQRTYEQQKRFASWQRAVLDDEDANLVVVECGAGSHVPTVRYTSERAVQKAGDRGFLIRINPDEPDLGMLSDSQGVGLPGGALDMLSELKQRLQ